MNKKWFRLDNAAKIYPAFASKKDPATFRVAVVLHENVDKLRLQEALLKTLPNFPSMAVTLRKGLFWHYLDENKREPKVSEEHKMPCSYIELNKNNGYLFQLLFYKKRISLECFHALTDGYGALEFLKAILYNYLFPNTLVHPEGLRLAGNSAEDVEDSYKKHAGSEYTDVKKEVAVHIKGTPIHKDGAFVHHGRMNSSKVKSVAKSYGTTITILLVSLYIQSILEVRKKGPVVITVPVNLRKMFESKTLRNFSYVINISCHRLLSLEDTIQLVAEQFKEQLDVDYLRSQFSKNVEYEKNLLLKIAPTDLKSFILRQARTHSSKKIVTSIVSNPGLVVLPSEMEPYVEHFECVLYASKPHFINMGVCSYNDQMVITLSRGIKETEIIESFFDKLKSIMDDEIVRYSNEGV